MKKRTAAIGALAVAAITLALSATLAGASMGASGSHARNVASKGPWVIGYSNGYYGNAARVQIEAEFKAYAALPSVAPHIKKYIINNAGVSVAAQIAAVDGMIAQHVNAIILDSNSLTGLNPAIAAAHKAGIFVVAENDKVSSPLAYQVETVGEKFGAALMQGFVNLLHGKGHIVVLRGLAGNAVDAAEASGFNGVLAKYPNIHVLNVTYGGWDDGQAQKDISDLLSRYNNIDGVFTEGGMEQGVVRAYLAGHHKFVPVSGTDENGFACQLKQYHSQGLSGVQIGSQFWESALALKVALALLSGKQQPHFFPGSWVVWNTAQSIKACNPKLSPSFFLQASSPPKYGINLTPAQVQKYMH
jgi:ribose transport system substrate-binding protein